MPKQSRTVHASNQAENPESRHLPLVDLLIDTRAELTELVVRSVWSAKTGSERKPHEIRWITPHG